MVTLILFDRHNPDADTLNTNKQNHIVSKFIVFNFTRDHTVARNSSRNGLPSPETSMPHKHQLDFDLKDDRRGKMSEINYRTLKLTPSFTSSETELPHSTTSKISKHRFAASRRILNEVFNAAHRKWKHSLMPQSREFASCERQIIRMQRLFSNQLDKACSSPMAAVNFQQN